MLGARCSGAQHSVDDPLADLKRGPDDAALPPGGTLDPRSDPLLNMGAPRLAAAGPAGLPAAADGRAASHHAKPRTSQPVTIPRGECARGGWSPHASCLN